MREKKALVTFCDHYGVWKTIERDFYSYFPMTNVPWVSPLQQQPRIIPQLDVAMQAFNKEDVMEAPVSLHLPPFVNLFVVACDDSDTYRQVVHQQLKEWYELVSQRKCQEYLILHVTKQAPGMVSAYLNLRMSVFDKLRAEFNMSKRERCYQIRLPDDPDAPRDHDAWGLFMDAFRECTMTSFEAHIQQYEEDIRRLDAQRNMPGWNYCTFFLMKEIMAQAFEAMNLLEESLIMYDELDASFYQIQVDGNLAWFKTFGGCDPGDDSADPFDGERKVYRAMIMDNNISLFDMHLYLFAKQSHLLGRLGRDMEVCERGYGFVMSFARNIKLNLESLPKHVEESWLFTTCMAIARRCLKVPAEQRKQPQFLVILTEMLYTARKQLDRLGIHFKLLPNAQPFSIQLVGHEMDADDARSSCISNEEILKAMTSPVQFDILYLRITKELHDAFMELGRDKYVWMLDSDVASLYLHRQNYELAVELLQRLTNRYARAGWHALEVFLRVQLSQSQKELGQHREYAEACLQLLKEPELVPKELIGGLCADLIAYAEKMDGQPRDFRPLFAVSLESKIEVPGAYTGIEVDVVSKFSADFPFESFTLKMLGGDMNELIFTESNGAVKPGKNRFILKCDNALAGNYVAEDISMHLGGLLFNQNYLNDQEKPVFRISPYTSPLTSEVSMAMLDDEPRILVRLMTRQHSITKGTIRLLPMTDVLSFTTDLSAKYSVDSSDIQDIKQSGGDHLSGEMAYVLPECTMDGIVDIYMPFAKHQVVLTGRIKIMVDYTNAEGKQYNFVDVRQVDMSSAFTVTHRTRMFGDKTLLTVQLLSQSDVPVRIVDQHLRLPKGFEILLEGQQNSINQLVFPQESYSLMYTLKQTDPDALYDGAKIVVGYSLVSDEMAKYISRSIYAFLQESKLEKHSGFIIDHMQSALKHLVEFNAVALTGRLDMKRIPIASFANALVHENEATRNEILETLNSYFTKYPTVELVDCLGEVDAALRRSIQEPLDLPESEIVTVVDISPADDRKDATIEQQCHYVLRVTQECSGANADLAASEVQIELQDDRENWLICGKKCARVQMTPKDKHEYALTLVPLKTGTLPLPGVNVHYITSTIPNTAVRLCKVESAVVLPKTRGASFFLDRV